MTPAEIEQAVVAARLGPFSPDLYIRLADYLALLVQWNGRFNLTAVRNPDEIVSRHIVESLFCAQHLPAGVDSLLDFGSGAGLPGIPIALARPEIQVTLGESQTKKAAFLREAVRVLALKSSTYGGRIEEMSQNERFNVVTLRAVDRMAEACHAAQDRVARGGWLAVFSTRSTIAGLVASLQDMAWRTPLSLPGSEQGILVFGRRLSD